MLLDQRLERLWGAPYNQGHRPSRVPGRAQTRDGAVASFLASQRPTLSVSQPKKELRAAVLLQWENVSLFAGSDTPGVWFARL